MNRRSSQIHPTAVIASGAKIGQGVVIEPYVVINSPFVVLEDDVTLKSHVYVDGHTTIGSGTTIYPSAIIGTKAQDMKYKGETTFVKIGKNCEIREYVTINSSCKESSVVHVGDHCMIMAYCHVAHNCYVGNHVILTNDATLAGYVTIEDYAIIGGMTPIHQNVRVGRNSMVGGMSRITHDIPPFTIGAGIPFKFGGLNVIGLKRHGFPLETRKELAKAFKILYRSSLYIEEALQRIEEELLPLPEVKYFVNFCRQTKRGLIGLHGIYQTDEERPQINDYEELEETEHPLMGR
jgi:UDP-N-acetylglucosamine acyltransferase